MRRMVLPAAAAATAASVATGMLVAAIFLTVGPLRAFAIQSTLRVTAMLPQADSEGRINVLVLGVGDKEHQAADLTDAMIVASIDPKTASVVMLSIPRDLAILDEDGTLLGRINSLYWSHKSIIRRQPGVTLSGASLLAMQALADDIGERVGVDIKGVVKMDFTGFTEIVDAVGGVDIEVPEAITDWTYPLEEGVVGKWEVAAGPQHFNGEEALRYARSRHSTSDFDRSARQQQIIAALVDVVKHQGIPGNLGLIRELQITLRDHVETTFTPRELLGLGGLLASMSQDHVIRMSLTYDSGNDSSDAVPGGFIRAAPPEIAGSGALLLPVSLSGKATDWGQIQTLAMLLFSHRELYLNPSRIVLRSEGASALHVHRLKNELIRYGFVAEKGETIDASGESRILVSSESMQESATFFATLLDLPIEEGDSETSDMHIILGKNYRYTPFEASLRK